MQLLTWCLLMLTSSLVGMKRGQIFLLDYMKGSQWHCFLEVMVVIWLHSPFTMIISLPASWVRFVYWLWRMQFYVLIYLDTCLSGYICSIRRKIKLHADFSLLLAVSSTYNVVSIGCWAECTTAVSSPWTTKSNISTCSQMAWDSCQSCFGCPWCTCWSGLVSGYKSSLLSLWACNLSYWKWRFCARWRKYRRGFKNWGKIAVIPRIYGILPYSCHVILLSNCCKWYDLEKFVKWFFIHGT